MEDIQAEPIVDAEPGSIEAVAAPSTPEETPTAQPDNDPKGIAFGKALTAEREKIRKEMETEYSEKYKDYDLHKDLSGYLSELNGGVDLLSLKERIEMERLEKRADENSATPEMQRRLEELEAKAAEGDKLKQDQQEAQRVTAYFSTMEKYLEGKGVESKDLNQFMVDNSLHYDPENMERSFDIAYKAMKSDEIEKKANEKEADTIKRYLASKNGVKVEGSTGAAAAQTVDTRKMSWAEIDKHAAERVKAMNTPQ